MKGRLQAGWKERLSVMTKMIYSEYLDEMIPSGFTIQKVRFTNNGSEPLKIGKEEHFFWDESDLVYYSDDIDGKCYMEIPKNGIKTLILKDYCHGRLLVKLDK